MALILNFSLLSKVTTVHFSKYKNICLILCTILVFGPNKNWIRKANKLTLRIPNFFFFLKISKWIQATLNNGIYIIKSETRLNKQQKKISNTKLKFQVHRFMLCQKSTETRLYLHKFHNKIMKKARQVIVRRMTIQKQHIIIKWRMNQI